MAYFRKVVKYEITVKLRRFDAWINDLAAWTASDNGRIGLTSPDNSTAFPSKGLQFGVRYRIVRSIVSTLYQRLITASSQMTNSRFQKSVANSLSAGTLQVLDSLQGMGILKVDCAVGLPLTSWAATSEDTAAMRLLLRSCWKPLIYSVGSVWPVLSGVSNRNWWEIYLEGGWNGEEEEEGVGLAGGKEAEIWRIECWSWLNWELPKGRYW